MWHFELIGNNIYAVNSYLQGSSFGESEVWGIRVGGRWTLDYTWKIMFHISDEDWNNKCFKIMTDKDFYDFCDWLGVRYKNENGKLIHNKKEVID